MLTHRHAGGAHIFTVQYILTYKFTLLHGPGSWTLQEKEAKESKPMHGPPLQARVVAANKTALQLRVDPGAHGMNRGVGKAK